MVKKLFLGFILSIFLVGTANAWYIELGDPYGFGTGTKMKAELTFHQDSGENFNLNNMGLAVSYTGATTMASVFIPTISSGGTYAVTYWEDPALGGIVDAGGLITGISGSEPLSNPNSFFPGVGDTLIGEVRWNADPGTIAISGFLVGSAQGTSVKIDGTSLTLGVELALSAADRILGPGSAPPPIPIPGAVYLLASGLIGLVGLRRRMK